MFCDGTTICTACRKRIPASSGICQMCGNTLEVRSMPRDPLNLTIKIVVKDLKEMLETPQLIAA